MQCSGFHSLPDRVKNKPFTEALRSRRRSFLALLNLKAYALAFLQGAETRPRDRGIMNKNITAFILLMKPKPFCSLNHFTVPSPLPSSL